VSREAGCGRVPLARKMHLALRQQNWERTPEALHALSGRCPRAPKAGVRLLRCVPSVGKKNRAGPASAEKGTRADHVSRAGSAHVLWLAYAFSTGSESSGSGCATSGAPARSARGRTFMYSPPDVWMVAPCARGAAAEPPRAAARGLRTPAGCGAAAAGRGVRGAAPSSCPPAARRRPC